MSNELGYTCQSVAHLELLCTPKERPKAIPEEFGRVFQHINGNMKDLSRALNEVDPGFNKQGIWWAHSQREYLQQQLGVLGHEAWNCGNMCEGLLNNTDE